MGQEYFINSQELEDKIRLLLPSQGGAGAGVDLSASTQIIPIVDLTQSAQGSNLRQDLQVAISQSTSTTFVVENTTSTIISNTGFFRVFGTSCVLTSTSTKQAFFTLTDGVTDKTLYYFVYFGSSNVQNLVNPFDFVVFLKAGDSMKIQAIGADFGILGSTRQIATIGGELVNPN